MGNQASSLAVSDEEDRLLYKLSHRGAGGAKACIAPQSTSLPLLAASRGYARVLGQLGTLSHTESTAFAKVRDNKLRTPLHLAAKAGHASAVAVLIDPQQLGSDLRAVDKRGNTALHLAAAGVADGHADCVALLLTAIRNREGQQGQQRTSNLGRASTRSQRLIDMQNSDGLTSLHLAAATGNLEVVQMLLSHGADLCLMTFKPSREWPWLRNLPARSTPLHLAAAAGHVMVAKAIVQAYLDIPRDVRKPDPRLLHDINGHVPYMVAGNNGHWLCAQLLLLISRDETHAYWQSYMQLGSLEVHEDPVPSLSSLAQAAWLAHLEDKLSEAATALPPPQQQQQQCERGSSVEQGAAGVAVPVRSCSESGVGMFALQQESTHEAGGARQVRHQSLSGAVKLAQQHCSRAPKLTAMEPTLSQLSCTATHEEATGKGRTCEVCFERVAGVELQMCGHRLCASCSKRVVRLEASKPGGAPKCPFCQQFILGFETWQHQTA